MLLSLMYVKGRGVPSYFPLSAGTARLDARNQFIEMYRAMEMTFWLPETETALAAMEGE
jgi:hypothetical protein